MQTSTEHSYWRDWFAGNAILKSMIPDDGELMKRDQLIRTIIKNYPKLSII